MRFYWLKDRYDQGQFNIYWAPGEENFADYTSKHHSVKHHKQTRPIWVYIEDISPRTVQGCIEILQGASHTSQGTSDRGARAPLTASITGRSSAPLTDSRSAPQLTAEPLSNLASALSIFEVRQNSSPVSPNCLSNRQVSPPALSARQYSPLAHGAQRISGFANTVLGNLLKRSFTYPLKRSKEALNISLSYFV